MYAHDMLVVFESDTLENLYSKMQSCVISLNDWMRKNDLKINILKTNYIIFNTKRKINLNLPNDLYLNNIVIEKVHVTKFLGLWIDSNLNWDTHINTIKKKIMPITFILRKTKNIFPLKIKMLIFNSYILSHIRYLLPIYGLATETRLKKLKVAMNRSMKIIKGLPYLT